MTKILVVLAVAGALMHAESRGGESTVIRRETTAADVVLTGDLRSDLFAGSMVFAPSANLQDAMQPRDHKSPWLAAGMSLVVPGAGEFYAESYWKAAAFFVVEVAAWSVAYTYDKKGDRQTDMFEGYAREHWSPLKYAQWTYNNAGEINGSVGLAPYQAIATWQTDGEVNWDLLNQLERELGSWYSHSLPRFGEQQYYELIGKYQQFYQGWDDADPTLTTYEEVTARLHAGGTNFTWYSGERGKANDFYNTASTAITVAVVNHILSALDAAWSAGSYNSVHASVGMQSLPVGGRTVHVPVVNLSYGF
jgi:hypothetical protein